MSKFGSLVSARWSDLVDRIRESRIASWLRTLTWSAALAWSSRLLKSFPDRAEQLRKLVTSVALVGVIIVGIWIVIDLSDNEPLAFDQIHVQPELARRMPPAERLTLQIGGHFESLSAAIERLRETEHASLAREADLPKLEILGSGVSFQAVVQVVRRLLGHRELRVGGEMYLSPVAVTPADERAVTAMKAACTDGEVVNVVVRLTTNRSEMADAADLPVCLKAGQSAEARPVGLTAEALEDMLQLAALRALERINPCGAAAYYTTNWHRRGFDGRMLDPDFRRSSALSAACIAVRGPAEAGYAFYLLGRVRQVSGRPGDAVRYYIDAEKLHIRSRSWLRRALHGIGLWRIRLPDLDVHWGNALMDDKQPREALARYERDLRRGSASAGAYIGKGNALRELGEGGPARALADAIAVYKIGAKRHRFDAELRHVLANALEQDPTPRATSEAKKRAAEEVLRYRRKAVDLQPTDRKYLLALGRSLREAGDLNAAAAVFREVMRLGGDNEWEAYAELASLQTARAEPPGPVPSSPGQSPIDPAPPDGTRGAVVPGPPSSSRPPPQTQAPDARVRYQTSLAALATGQSEEALQRASAVLAGITRPQEARLALACTERCLKDAKANPTDTSGYCKPSVGIDEALRGCLNDIRRVTTTSGR